MAAINAALSQFSFGASNISAIGSVSVSSGRQPIDITTIGAANQYFLAGVMGTVVSLDVYYNITDHSSIVANMTNSSSASAFVVTMKSGDVVSGSGFVTQADIVASAGDVVRANITIVATGKVVHGATTAFGGVNE